VGNYFAKPRKKLQKKACGFEKNNVSNSGYYARTEQLNLGR